jgi:hypothetical protein
MVAEPAAMAVILPLATLAISVALLVHVRLVSAALSGVMVAVNVSLAPTASVSVVLFSVTPEACTGAGSSLLHEVQTIAAIAATSSMFTINFIFLFIILFIFVELFICQVVDLKKSRRDYRSVEKML